jgi:hypothetical protein
MELVGFIIRTSAQLMYPTTITVRYTAAIFRPSHEMPSELLVYRPSVSEAQLNVLRYTPCSAVVELVTSVLLQ